MATYIAHHGILGMKWGIRRYQNKDGTLTAEGRQRYGVGEDYDPNRPTPEQDLARHNRRVKTAKRVAIITGATAITAYMVSPKVREAVKGALGKIGKNKIGKAAVDAANGSDELRKYAKTAAADAIKNGLDEDAKKAIAKSAREEVIKNVSENARSAVKDTITPKTSESFGKLLGKGIKEGAKEGAINAPKNFTKIATFGLVTLGLKEVTDIIAGKALGNEKAGKDFADNLYKANDKEKMLKPSSWQMSFDDDKKKD